MYIIYRLYQMATPTAPKRPRLGTLTFMSPQRVRNIMSQARSTPFPWASAVPPAIADWFESFAKSRNTLPEFVFAAAITAVAALMGPNVFVRLREEYSEPVNIYTVIMAEPGAGKSQAFRLAVIDPLESMQHFLIDDYTRKGLFRHLQRTSGRGLLAYEELTQFFEVVHKRQLEGTGERQIFCRLYDSGRWTVSVGKTPVYITTCMHV